MHTHASFSTKPLAVDDESPFNDDLLGRKPLADRLSSFVDRLPNGATLGIDAPWGEGKSWFGTRWATSLRASGHKVAFIDAFEQDYADDPFLLVASELSRLLDGDRATKVLAKKAGKVMRALAPLTAKAVINFTGRALLGSANLTGDLAELGNSAAGTAAVKAEQWIERRVEAFEAEKKSIDEFRSALTKAVQASEKRVVVFIDELDRCRPSFAVTMIERVKHLFDVPNLVFVLLLNRTQLEKAIQGIYGEGVDGPAYLGKFVNIWFDLPAIASRDPDSPGKEVQWFVRGMEGRYIGAAAGGEPSNFAYDMSVWARFMGLSLRDLERACTLYAVASSEHSGILSYLIATKVKQPVVFSALRRGDQAPHKARSDWLEGLIVGDRQRWPNALLVLLSCMHRVLGGEPLEEGKKVAFAEGGKLLGDRDPIRAFWRLSDLIDLPLGR